MKIIFQGACSAILLGLICLLSLYAITLFEIPLPPALLGILVLFVGFSLLRKVPRFFEPLLQFLLRHMALFLVPAVLVFVVYLDVFHQFPLAMLVALVATTLISLAITAWIAQLFMPKSKRDD